MKTPAMPAMLLLVLACTHAFAFNVGIGAPSMSRIRNGIGVRRPARSPRCAVAEAEAKKKVLVVGAGWGGLGAAWHLSKRDDVHVTLIDAAPRVGGLIRDGFQTQNGRPAEAGMHGFWDEYKNIFHLVDQELELEDVFTDYALQGQYSPRGLEAIWPIYRNEAQLPTGMGQAIYTKFLNLPPTDLVTAAPLVAAFSEILSSDEVFDRYSTQKAYSGMHSREGEGEEEEGRERASERERADLACPRCRSWMEGLELRATPVGDDWWPSCLVQV